MTKRFTFFLIILSSLFGCKNDSNEKPDISKIQLDLNYKDISPSLFKIKNTQEVDSFLINNPALAIQYFKTTPGNVQEQVKGFIANISTNQELRNFYSYTDSSFASYPLKEEMTQMYRYLKFYYPQFKVPEVNTVVTGFNLDELSVSDSLVVISLDYFIGDSSKFRPQLYSYMLERYNKPYIVPFLALATSYKFNEGNPKDETMLAHMIHYGKAMYFMEKVLPDAPESLIVMYSDSTIKDVNDNADVIYAHFVKNQLFFETRPKLIEKYLGESPKISEIGEKCPGRIGRWLGWEIVKKYMEENPEVTLQDLMKDTDVQKIFKQSKYRPKKK